MRSTRAATAAMCALLVLIACADRATAATVTVLDRDGHTHAANNPFLNGSSTSATGAQVRDPLTIGGALVHTARATNAAAAGTQPTGGGGIAPPPTPPPPVPTTPPTTTVPTTTSTTPTTPATTTPTSTSTTSTSTTPTTTFPTLPSLKPPATPKGCLPPKQTKSAATAATTKNSKTTKKKKQPAVQGVTVSVCLQALQKAHQISQKQYRGYLNQWNSALKEEKQLSKTRSTQLVDVTTLLHNIAAEGDMTASRLPVLFLTLQRNAQYWPHGAMLSYGARVQFSGSETVWEYYPGQGIQLQVLGTFGEADGYYEAGPKDYGKLKSLIKEMLPLAVQRAGGLAWEYYFNWEGGTPPWVSAMSQATAIEALSNAYLATGDESYLTIAHESLPLLETKPPTGVGVRTALGRRYLQYSFEPTNDIINAYLQTLVGLDHYAKISGDRTAKSLFNSGNAQAVSELGSFDTGAWSLYQPGEEDSLSYHELVTGFAQNLCQLTATLIYCKTAADFQQDLKVAPVLRQVTTSVKPKTKFEFRFSLSKISKVGIIISNANKTFLSTSAEFGHGTDSVNVGPLKKGLYNVQLSATDLAGNHSSVTGQFGVGVPAPPLPPAPAPTPAPTVKIPTKTTTFPTPAPVTTTPTTATTTTTTTTTTQTAPTPPLTTAAPATTTPSPPTNGGAGL